METNYVKYIINKCKWHQKPFWNPGKCIQSKMSNGKRERENENMIIMLSIANTVLLYAIKWVPCPKTIASRLISTYSLLVLLSLFSDPDTEPVTKIVLSGKSQSERDWNQNKKNMKKKYCGSQISVFGIE